MAVHKIYRLSNVFVQHYNGPMKKDGQIGVCSDWVDILQSFKGRPISELVAWLNLGALGTRRAEARDLINYMVRKSRQQTMWPRKHETDAVFILSDFRARFTKDEQEVFLRKLAVHCDLFKLTEYVEV